MGDQLLGEITEATGLPEKMITDELERLIERAGKEADSITLDELRLILADYVQDILLSVKEESVSASESATKALAKSPDSIK